MNAIVVGLDGSTGSEHALVWEATRRAFTTSRCELSSRDDLHQHHADGDNVFDPPTANRTRKRR